MQCMHFLQVTVPCSHPGNLALHVRTFQRPSCTPPPPKKNKSSLQREAVHSPLRAIKKESERTRERERERERRGSCQDQCSPIHISAGNAIHTSPVDMEQVGGAQRHGGCLWLLPAFSPFFFVICRSVLRAPRTGPFPYSFFPP